MELVNFLLKCGDDVRLWVSRRLRGQCEQQWGALCHTFGSPCPLGNQSDNVQNAAAATILPTTAPAITAQGRSQRQPTTAAEAEEKRSAQEAAAAATAATSGLLAFEKTNMTVA